MSFLSSFPSIVRVACLSPRDVSFWRRAEPPSCCKHWSLCWNWPGSTAALTPSRLDTEHYLCVYITYYVYINIVICVLYMSTLIFKVSGFLHFLYNTCSDLWHWLDRVLWSFFGCFFPRISSTPAKTSWSQPIRSSLIETSRRKWTFSARFSLVCSTSALSFSNSFY